MEDKKIKVDPITEEVEVPIDLTSFEVVRLKEKLELFNNNVPEEKKLSFEEFIAVVFKVSLLEEELDTKYNYLRRLKAEVKELEEELLSKYSIGLTGSEEVYTEIIELRKQTLEDSIVYVKNYKSDYISLLVNYIGLIVYASTYEDGILTLKESFEVDIEKNPSDVYKAIQIVKHDVKPSGFEEVERQLDYFDNYVKNYL